MSSAAYRFAILQLLTDGAMFCPVSAKPAAGAVLIIYPGKSVRFQRFALLPIFSVKSRLMHWI